MGAHVSEVPNQQVGRVTPLETRANAAMFGVFGYELDLTRLSGEETALIRSQIAFAKQHRRLVMTGDFYRLSSPFEGNDAAWIVVSPDKTEALAGFYRMSGVPNSGWIRIRLAGLNPEKDYVLDSSASRLLFGVELMNAGLVIGESRLCNPGGDYSSGIFYLRESACNVVKKLE